MPKEQKIFNALSGQHQLTLENGPGEYRDVQFSPNNQHILTVATQILGPIIEVTAHTWDLRTGKALSDPMRHERQVQGIAFSENGNRLITVTLREESFNQAHVWDVLTGKSLLDPLKHTSNYITARAFSRDGNRVVVVDKNKAFIWDIPPQKIISDTEPQENNLTHASLSPSGRIVATAKWTESGAVRLYDAETGKPATGPLVESANVAKVAFSGDGLRLTTAGAEITRVWETSTGKVVSRPMAHGGQGDAVLSWNGGQLITASGGTVEIWDVIHSVLTGA